MECEGEKNYKDPLSRLKGIRKDVINYPGGDCYQ